MRSFIGSVSGVGCFMERQGLLVRDMDNSYPTWSRETARFWTKPACDAFPDCQARPHSKIPKTPTLVSRFRGVYKVKTPWGRGDAKPMHISIGVQSVGRGAPRARNVDGYTAAIAVAHE